MTGKIVLLIPVVYAGFNIISFTLYGLDKVKAKRDQWRISEKTLLTVSFFGPVGAWLGMQQFRHKTQKPLFRFAIPFFILLHIIFVLRANLQ